MNASNREVAPARRILRPFFGHRLIVVAVAVVSVVLPGHAVLSWTQSDPQVTVSVLKGTSTSLGTAISPSSAGGVIIGGKFKGTIDFDPGPEVLNLTATSIDDGAVALEDGFVGKFDIDGNLLWVRRIAIGVDGASGTVEVTSVAEDTSGNVFVSGNFRGKIDLDPGPTAKEFASVPDMDDTRLFTDGFLVKLNVFGNFEWGGVFGADLADEVASVRTDTSGNVYVAGTFRNTVDFDLGVGTVYRTSVGSGDGFIVKYSAAGNVVWTKSIEGVALQDAFSMVADGLGNLFVMGEVQGVADFNSHIVGVDNLPFPTARGSRDGFIIKLSASGGLVWVKRFGGSSSGITEGSIAVDRDGATAVVGTYYGTVDFDPDIGVASMTADGDSDSFVLKMDTAGTFEWVKSFRTSTPPNSVSLNSVAVGQSGMVSVVGSFTGLVDFDPGPDATNLEAAGGDDIVAAKLDASGGFVRAHRFGADMNDAATASFVDASDNLHVTGSFGGTVDFDPGSGRADFASGRDGLGSDVPTAFFMRTDRLGSTATTTTTSTTSSTTAPSTSSTTTTSSTTSTPVTPSTTITLSNTTTTSTTSTTIAFSVAPPATSVSATSTTTSTIATPSPQRAPSESVISDLPRAIPGLVSRPSFEPGGSVSVTHSGFVPGERVQLVVASKPRILASGDADFQGTVSLRGVIPSNLPPGEHTLAVYAPASRRGFKQAIVVSGGSLPATGSRNAGLFVLASTFFVCAGSVFMRLARSTRNEK